MTNNAKDLTDILKIEGVNAKGYGLAPKLVMQDRRLSRDAKAIYCYFSSFAGKGDTAFPGVSKICYDLGFKTEDTYRKHLNQLKKYDYIKVFQQRSKGKFQRNVYTIINNPNPKEYIDIENSDNRNEEKKEITAKDSSNKKTKSPTPKKQGYGKKQNGDEIKPTPKNSGDGIKPVPKKAPPNNNNEFNNNKDSNNNSDFNNNNNKENNTKKLSLSDIEQFKTIKCRYNDYEINNKNQLAIHNAYKDKSIVELNNAIDYIIENEPKDSYHNIIGAIISAAQYNIEPINKTISKNKRKYKRTNFHNFEQRTDGYTNEELEDVVRKKRMEYKRFMVDSDI